MAGFWGNCWINRLSPWLLEQAPELSRDAVVSILGKVCSSALTCKVLRARAIPIRSSSSLVGGSRTLRPVFRGGKHKPGPCERDWQSLASSSICWGACAPGLRCWMVGPVLRVYQVTEPRVGAAWPCCRGLPSLSALSHLINRLRQRGFTMNNASVHRIPTPINLNSGSHIPADGHISFPPRPPLSPPPPRPHAESPIFHPRSKPTVT